ncbi:MAG: UDP-4-amino-4-deoxy-L-arabinose--oxoglutarate aminotransferase [Pelotomaculum sp. PtaB.Bin013]|uniref:DegT/DnrJ/EryC1/StrS family aminotransferase n=1 Tax=Pelotomaculum isophthalicicum JI TaxID=947010 RepID=A0A9X4JVR6_9FIRM|nr:DegT/DnrJ/EryC1/StrS family aminotransferase [Pelotomaculum isophthalicicum]MDF9407873.1 DegT/DnrJ/EryC1/StrS family aminotransferase [Pelotomaculum isophthalicicum JI]OPX88878.1 MAG: UDP-4-amino-4-deoxy-L-arabinose--oxoglutarate aminotransferase [Pelotomaculum sp. PtaB.Bin013]
MNVPLSSPDIGQRERELVNAVLDSNILSIGPQVEQFERMVADYLGVKEAVAVNSGTSGLHLAVRGLGISAGDEVITSPFSFVSSSNCMLYENARPVFVDIDPLTLNIDPEKIEAKITSRTRAILPVHVFGRPADMGRIMEVARQYRLAVIEDACEAIGARYREKMVGSESDAAVFAFYPNKQITTGEGGVISTNNSDLAGLCRSMRNQGRNSVGGWFNHCRLGYNYRLDELSAALGVAQMEYLDEILAKREAVAMAYNARLERLEGVALPYLEPGIKISWFVYVVRLAPGIDRDRVMAYLQGNGVDCRPYFQPIHLQPFYQEKFGYQSGDFPNTEFVASSTLALPFFNNITEKQLDYVVEVLTEAIRLDAKGS